MYGFSDQPNIMPFTRLRADLQGSSRYAAMAARIEHLFDSRHERDRRTLAPIRDRRARSRQVRASLRRRGGGGPTCSLGIEALLSWLRWRSSALPRAAGAVRPRRRRRQPPPAAVRPPL